MAKLDETSVVELLKELSSKLAGGVAFDDALAWKMVNDKIEEENRNAPPKKKGERKEYIIILNDPDGKLPSDITGWIAQKDKEPVVDEKEDTTPIHAWEDNDHQLEGLIQIAHETLMDDNTNKYTGKGFADMLKHGKKTMKSCGIVLKSKEVEAVPVSINTVPQWVVRVKSAEAK